MLFIIIIIINNCPLVTQYSQDYESPCYEVICFYSKQNIQNSVFMQSTIIAYSAAVVIMQSTVIGLFCSCCHYVKYNDRPIL